MTAMSDADRVSIIPNIRWLWAVDKPALLDHFNRLDPTTRRLRFGTSVPPKFIADYAERILSIDRIVYGAFVDGTLRGVGEMHALPDHWPTRAEIALSVEAEWQAEGIGDALFSRMVTAAQNRGVRKLFMLCLRENNRMQRLARKHAAILSFDIGDVEATLDAPWPTPLSLAKEMMGETHSYLRAVLQPQT